jgi:hypothetical protein
MQIKPLSGKGNPMRKLTDFKPYYVNKPEQKGELADAKCLFGGYSRYAVAPVYTRFDAVEWFVWDAEKIMTGNYHEPIRQAPTLEEAIKGL